MLWTHSSCIQQFCYLECACDHVKYNFLHRLVFSIQVCFLGIYAEVVVLAVSFLAQNTTEYEQSRRGACVYPVGPGRPI